VVKNITDFGAFIDLGGVDGLLHITDMSYGRVSHPTEMVAIGKEVEVKILDIDWQRERISLGMKQLQSYPWQNVAAKYPVGTRVQGKVVSITNYGAFVEIEPGIDGLIHISDMSWTKRVQHPSEVVKKGDAVDVVILNIDAENKRISLGLKQAEEDPWLKIGETYPIGMEMRGRAVRLMDKGVVVDLGNDIEGFVPMSQLGVPNLENPGDAVKEGQALDLKVLEVDPIHHRIVLAVIGFPDEPIIPPVKPVYEETTAPE
jgi:small subunit ribosomal protein S1